VARREEGHKKWLRMPKIISANVNKKGRREDEIRKLNLLCAGVSVLAGNCTGYG